MVNNQIQAIFFDISDVLATGSIIPGIRHYESIHGIEKDRLYIAVHDHSYWKDFSLGKISEAEYFKSVEKSFSGELDITELKESLLGSLAPNKMLVELVKTLANRYIIGVVSNNPKEWFDIFCERNKLNDVFKVKAVSGHLGIRKPDKRLFEIALKIAGAAPENSIYVDDRPEMTIEAAELGINILIYQGLEKFKEDLKKFKII